jgi:exopolysaccharide biosynthesis predicted pyruvyltransferase EpsI
MAVPNENPEVLSQLSARINEVLTPRLKGRSRLAIVDFPDSINCGDLAIWHGEMAFLNAMHVSPAYRCSMQTYDRTALAAALGEDGLLLLHGGGNFGDLYIYHQFRDQVLHDFPHHDALMFPQTVKFFGDESMRRTADFYNARGRLFLCARDSVSLEVFRHHFSGCESALVPDMAFALGPQARPHDPVDDILWLARTDAESRFDKGRELRAKYATATQIATVRFPGVDGSVSVQTHRGNGLRITDWYEMRLDGDRTLASYSELTFDEKARVQVGWAKLILSMGQVVVTDRLHAHILCTLMGIPHVVYDNNYGKLQQFIDTWSMSHLVQLSTGPEEALRIARDFLNDRPERRSGPA